MDKEKNLIDILNLGGCRLTTFGFNEISNIKVKSYTNVKPKRTWIDILKSYGKYEELIDYIVEEYKVFVERYDLKSIQTFCKKHDYIKHDLILLINPDTIKQKANVKKMRHAAEDFRDNFFNMVEMFGRIPQYAEFDEETKIPINSYASHLKLKGKVYENIVDFYIKDDALKAEYRETRKKYKSELGKLTGSMSSVQPTDEELESEFKAKFDWFLSTYGVSPPRRTFNKFLKYDITTYRTRFGLSWTQICEKYGYTVTREANRSEEITLKNFKVLLNENYIAQKTWNWLIGAGGKNMYCDGYFPRHNLVVEFDGSQHRRPIVAFGGQEQFTRRLENDKLKDKLLSEQGINLIRIDSREPWYDVNHIEDKLRKMGII